MVRKAPRKSPRRRAGKCGSRWLPRLLALVVLIALFGGGWAWWESRSWRPDEGKWADQGALVGEVDGTVRFATLKGLGAGFVYLEASRGADGKDAAFPDNFAAARAAGLQIGAVHRFDPCARADGQSANFVTTVPRDVELLPPAIMLERTAEDCPERVSRAAVQSEVMTLVNQIEAHTGKPVILAPSEDFEQGYAVAARIDRNLWLSRNWNEPTYGGRPWLLWTANSAFQTEAAEQPLRWMVVRP
ncbi:lysozyme [Erythrobacter sp. QSSC1-22B]|uniref:glycoside hydrolase family 25 protein n=1 Tax=Erythrobacter sp. QSSC1-22B TaxID=1860125 RepID=UPI000805DEC0|nr:glycoside hydrolase family 25 protein [Erythrobacter sp. QSSC1-22B]OBX18750.1 lysozyme [Erythrobacter sp. QSSC1-22B]